MNEHFDFQEHRGRWEENQGPDMGHSRPGEIQSHHKRVSCTNSGLSRGAFREFTGSNLPYEFLLLKILSCRKLGPNSK